MGDENPYLYHIQDAMDGSQAAVIFHLCPGVNISSQYPLGKTVQVKAGMIDSVSGKMVTITVINVSFPVEYESPIQVNEPSIHTKDHQYNVLISLLET